MRIQFKREGGLVALPGLSRPVTIDSDQLPEDEARELEQMVAAARVFERAPDARALPAGARDIITYTVTVEDGGRHHTVQMSDLTQDPDLQRLLVFLKAKARAA
jgi:hypothetical protein